MEELSDVDVDNYITCISTRSSIVVIDDIVVIFKHPTNLVRQRADMIYTTEFEKAKQDGLLDRESLEKLIEERNLFTAEDKTRLSKLEAQLEAQKVLLGKTTLVKANQDRIKNTMVGLRDQINELMYNKTSKLMMSADVKAHEERSLFLCWNCTYDNDSNLYWDTYQDFKKTTDIAFRSKILAKFLEFTSGLSNKTIRYIARHNLWRIRFVTSQKVTESLFGVPTVEYSNDMLNLAYWSNYYDNIYQMMPEDRPSDAIIDDDDALDSYMKAHYEERNREEAARRSKKNTPGKLSAFDSEEVIVTASNELWQDIEYDKPKEAQRLKGRTDIKKRTKRGRA
jgi:hypothetical protein